MNPAREKLRQSLLKRYRAILRELKQIKRDAEWWNENTAKHGETIETETAETIATEAKCRKAIRQLTIQGPQ